MTPDDLMTPDTAHDLQLDPETGRCPDTTCCPVPRSVRYWPTVAEQLAFITDRTRAMATAVESVRPLLDAAAGDVVVRFNNIETPDRVNIVLHHLPGGRGLLDQAAGLADALGLAEKSMVPMDPGAVHVHWAGSLGGFAADLVYVDDAPEPVHTFEDSVAEIKAVSEATAERVKAERELNPVVDVPW